MSGFFASCIKLGGRDASTRQPMPAEPDVAPATCAELAAQGYPRTDEEAEALISVVPSDATPLARKLIRGLRSGDLHVLEPVNHGSMPQEAAATTTAPLPRIGLTREEAAAAIGMSLDSFERHVQPTLRLVRLGRMRVVPVRELERWLGEHAGRALS